MSFKIIFIEHRFAVPALKAINDTNHEILGFYNHPKKRMRSKNSKFSSHIYSNKFNIPVRCQKILMIMS